MATISSTRPAPLARCTRTTTRSGLQDTWDVSSRLTLNLGVRVENEYIPSYKNQEEFPDALDIKFDFKDKIAPRLGFAYDVKGDGKWKADPELRLVLRHHEAGAAARFVWRSPLGELLLDARHCRLQRHSVRRRPHGLPGPLYRISGFPSQLEPGRSGLRG